MLIVNESNFDIVISNYKTIMVGFYDPNSTLWTEFIENVFRKASRTVKTVYPDCFFVLVNIILSPQIAKKYHSTYMIDIKLFYNKMPINYEGSLIEKDIVNWIDFKIKKIAKVIYSVKD